MGVEVCDPRWLAAVPGAELVVALDEVGGHAADGHRVTVLIDLVPDNVAMLRGLATEAVGEGARKVRVRPHGVDRVDLVYAAVELGRVAEDDAVEVQFDVTSAALLRADPTAFVRVDPFVVKADGTVVPICTGLEGYALGELGSFENPGPVSKSMFAIAGPDAAPGGTAERPTYNSGMRAIRPHHQEPPQARLSSNGTSIQALVAAWDPEPVRDLCRVALGRALADTGPLVSWYEHLTRTAAELRSSC
ncbi:hypothetical protein PV646_39120 [Streptomyces sp. ID05-26A]|nr:hypothetical protein [Streptomyces sp. ID05-26A]